MMISLLIIAFTDILITQIHYNSGSQILPLSWHSDLYMSESRVIQLIDGDFGDREHVESNKYTSHF